MNPHIKEAHRLAIRNHPAAEVCRHLRLALDECGELHFRPQKISFWEPPTMLSERQEPQRKTFAFRSLKLRDGSVRMVTSERDEIPLDCIDPAFLRILIKAASVPL